MTITATNSRFNNVDGANCTDCVALTFTDCTGDYCVSSDESANFGSNSLLNQPINSWLTVDNEINEIGQAVLTGASSTGGNIIEFNWEAPPVSSLLNGVIRNIPCGRYNIKFHNDDVGGIIKEEELCIFSDGAFTTPLSVAVGTNVFYGYKGDNGTGFANFGVTE